MTALKSGVVVHVGDQPDGQVSDWARLCFPEHPNSLDYLHAIAGAGIDCVFRYFTARHDGQVVGVAHGFLMRYPIAGRLSVPVFVGGSPVNIGSPFYFESSALVGDVLPPLLDAMVAEANALRAKLLLVRDLWEPEGTAACGPELLRRGFRRAPMFQDAVLPVRWPDFDGYLEHLPADRRKNVRRDARRFEQGGYRVEIGPAPLPDQLVATMHKLWAMLYDKYRDRDQVWLPEQYFARVSALPDSSVLLALRGDELVGFDLLLQRGDVLESVYSGVDRTRVGNTPVHRHLGSQIIRLAVERRLRMVDFGISNEHSKIKMGCELRMAWAYVRPLSRAVRLLRLDRIAFPAENRSG